MDLAYQPGSILAQAQEGHILSLASSAQGEAALVLAEVPIGTANTLQVVLGDWVGWLCLIGMIVFMLHAPISKVWRRLHSSTQLSTITHSAIRRTS